MTLAIDTAHPTYEQLPATFSILLNTFSAISLSGEEQTKYLQGQVTCDVNAADDKSLTHGAHCNAKGKVFSVFRLINRFSEHLLLQNKATLTASIAELKKFGVFAKVTIEETENLAFAAIVGERAAEILQNKYHTIPDSLSPVIQVDSTTLVYIAGIKPRYLLIDDKEKTSSALKQFSLPVFGQSIWQLLEITEGFPNLNEPSIAEHAPQVFNVQAINGISFTKGCYLGQETVARMQYLGKNKRALFALSSNVSADVNHGDIIERQIGDNWRKAGDVIEYYQNDEQGFVVQAILASDITSEDNLRLKKNESSTLYILPLPYSLD